VLQNKIRWIARSRQQKILVDDDSIPHSVRPTLTLAPAAEPASLPTNLTLNEALGTALNNSTAIRDAVTESDQAFGRSTKSKSPLIPQTEHRLAPEPGDDRSGGIGHSDRAFDGEVGAFRFNGRSLLPSAAGIQPLRPESLGKRSGSAGLVALRVVAGYVKRHSEHFKRHLFRIRISSPCWVVGLLRESPGRQSVWVDRIRGTSS
jgi:hypothetical protein